MTDQQLINSCNSPQYVDIHGRNVKVFISERNKDIFIPLTEIKQTGFSIFEQTQFNKLSISPEQFNEEFNLYILNRAKAYMLRNQITFESQDILRSIENCKQILNGTKPKNPKYRTVKKTDEEDLQINFINIPNSSQLTVGNLHQHNKNDTKTPLESSSKAKQLNRLSSSQGSSSSEISPKKAFVSDLRTKLSFNSSVDSTNGRNDQNTSFSTCSSSGGMPNPKKIAFPKPLVMKFDQAEHEVIVCCVINCKTAWVRDKKHEHLLDDIYNKMTQHEPIAKVVPKSELVFNQLYMAQHGEDLFRCKVIKFLPALRVFSIDYGNLLSIEDLKDLPSELASIPCLANRITIDDALNLVEEDEIKITPICQNKDESYQVEIIKDHNQTIPPPLTQLSNGLKIKISYFTNTNTFYVRTKQCQTVLQEINDLISKINPKPLTSDTITINQLVLCKESPEKKFKRAVVLNLLKNGAQAQVRFLDYHGTTVLNISLLAEMSATLMALPLTYLETPALRSFPTEFSTSVKQFLKGSIVKQNIYTLFYENGDFDLLDGSDFLSEKLRNFEVGCESAKLMVSDLTMFVPKMGENNYMCFHFKNPGDFVLVPGKELQENLSVITSSIMKDIQPYCPEVGEVCFGFYINKWYRVAISRILNREYEVLFIDFGNTDILKSEHLRKAIAKFQTIPALALPCKLIDLPNCPDIVQIIKNKVIQGEAYVANFKRHHKGKYEVTMPCIYDQILKKS